MSKDEVMPRALVIFRWNRRSQTDPDLERRARALDGRVVRIMDKPFWNNERRIQIQSLEDSNLTLGVRMKYLELIRLPQPTNEHTEIDLFVYRSDPFTNILPHIASNEYLRQELRIADDAQYQNVITNHPNITILPSIGSNKWTPCIDSGIYGPNLALILLMKGMNFMISLQMPDKNAVDKLRTLLSGLLWHIWEFEQLDPTIPPFPEMLEYHIFTVWTSPAIRKVMLRHYNRLEYYQQFVTLEAELEASDAWRFAMFTIQEHIERQTSLFEHQLERSLASNLDISAMEFYEKQIQSMDALFRSNDSEFMQTLLEIVDLYKDHNISAERISVRCERIKSHVQDYAIKILHFLESMRYYLSVGEILVNLRESGDAGGRIAIVCIQNFITGDWVRAIADIMRCSQRCVAMKVIPNDKRKRETEESPRAFVGLLSNSSTTCENGIRSQNQENNEPIVEANAAQTYHNRATITLYGLIPSQRNLHGELQQHLLSTRKSDLFISMHKIPDSQHRPGMASKTYWTEHDEILEILIGILKDPRMWLDSDYTTDLMRSCLKYFAELDDVQEVDELVTSMEEYHSRTSREHQLLCQDVGHSIILFRKMIGRDISSRSDGRTLRVKLRNTVDTLDLAVAWWQLALSKIVQQMNREVKAMTDSMISLPDCNQMSEMPEMTDALLFFMLRSHEIFTLMEQYSQYIKRAFAEFKKEKLEFIIDGNGIDSAIHEHFRMITSTKHYWSIAMQCLNWTHQGNKGEITVILPGMQSMSLMHKLLRDIGIREEDKKMFRVEQQIQMDHVGPENEERMKRSSNFNMTQISLSDKTRRSR